MDTRDLRFLLVAAVVFNVFAALISSHSYTSWSIRTRNLMYYYLLRRPVNKERADRADEIAEENLWWIRLLIFTIANLFVIAIAVQTLRAPAHP